MVRCWTGLIWIRFYVCEFVCVYPGSVSDCWALLRVISLKATTLYDWEEEAECCLLTERLISGSLPVQDHPTCWLTDRQTQSWWVYYYYSDREEVSSCTCCKEQKIPENLEAQSQRPCFVHMRILYIFQFSLNTMLSKWQIVSADLS